MFGLKKKSPAAEENKNSFLTLNQKKDLNIEEMPIHTMQEDLENIKNPSVSHGVISSPLQEKNLATRQETLTQKQKTSPFLKLNENDLPLENAAATIDKKSSPVKASYAQKTDLIFSSIPADEKAKEQKNVPLSTKTAKTLDINWRSMLFFTSSLITIAILIIAGYYFSKNKIDLNLSDLLKNPLSSESNTAPTTENPLEIEPPITKPELSYSHTNSNYLKLEDSGLDAITVLQQHIQTVSQESYAAPVEFVITDQQNAPIAFNDFAAKIGLKLSAQVMENLGSNFSLFIYNDVSVTRVGLSVDLSIESKDNNKLTGVLLQEEKTLADELSPLFFTTDYKTEKFFGNSEYAGIKIRFQNVISPDNLSVDYAIDKNKLLIGTTKLTLRAIIDYINNPVDNL